MGEKNYLIKGVGWIKGVFVDVKVQQMMIKCTLASCPMTECFLRVPKSYFCGFKLNWFFPTVEKGKDLGISLA